VARAWRRFATTPAATVASNSHNSIGTHPSLAADLVVARSAALEEMRSMLTAMVQRARRLIANRTVYGSLQRRYVARSLLFSNGLDKFVLCPTRNDAWPEANRRSPLIARPTPLLTKIRADRRRRIAFPRSSSQLFQDVASPRRQRCAPEHLRQRRGFGINCSRPLFPCSVTTMKSADCVPARWRKEIPQAIWAVLFGVNNPRARVMAPKEGDFYSSARRRSKNRSTAGRNG